MMNDDALIVCDLCGTVTNGSFWVRGLDDGTTIEICDECHLSTGDE